MIAADNATERGELALRQAKALDELLAGGNGLGWPSTVKPAGWRGVCPRCGHIVDHTARGTVEEAARDALDCDCTPDTCPECPA